MPIYEFYCNKCNMILNFFSASVNIAVKPNCPRCKRTRLKRQISSFSTPRNKGEGDEMGIPGMDESGMEKALSAIAKEAAKLDGKDPRQAGDLVRKMSDMTGFNLGSGMKEALARIEAGEDPAQIEAEMGDLLEAEDPFRSKEKAGRPVKKQPPKTDDKLYYL